MPEPSIAITLFALVVLVESASAVRLPIGLLLAIGLLASGAELLPIALLGAAAVTAARLSLALAARSGRDRLGGPPTPETLAQRAALRATLSGSRTYARTSFLLAATPGVPASFVFPMLGAMRAPLWPALLGTLVGRTPVLALTAALFAWLGRAVSDGDPQAAVTLGMLAILLFVFRTLGRVDWAHRSETGEWRMRGADDQMARMAAMLGGSAVPPGAGLRGRGAHASSVDDDDDVLEGELLGEDVLDDDSDDEPPAALPPNGAAPA